MDELLREFLTESFDSLAVLDDEIVRLERNPDDALPIAGIFRVVHTIKGTCGFLDLPRLAKVAHAAESLLDRLRDGGLPVTPPAVGLILAAIDRIKAILVGLEALGLEPPGDDAELIGRLDAMAAGAGDRGGQAAEAPLEPRPAAAGDDGPARSAITQRSLRVDVELLDRLTTLVGELVLTRNRLVRMAREREDGELLPPLLRLSRITTELRDGVMRTRMQPIGNAWSQLPRLVRDLGEELGKGIELRTSGADTELDRRALELIKAPLVHMVRNAADHGLESPKERRAAGKPAQGTIALDARHEGGHVVVEVGDDGRGLAVEAIAARAVACGLATEAELARLSPRQVQALIFKPGLSTATRVSSVSGRGVGLDVVRTNVERVGGSIGLDSTPGRGTRFTIKIPVAPAIIAALVVESAGLRFAIPQTGVVELVRAGPRSEHPVEIIGGAPILRLRERLLPVMPLSRLLGRCRDEDLLAAKEVDIVVARVKDAAFGLAVDRILDSEEIVLEPVSPALRGIGAYAGSTVLGDGSIVMILDLGGLLAADEAPKAVPLALVARPDATTRRRRAAAAAP